MPHQYAISTSPFTPIRTEEATMSSPHNSGLEKNETVNEWKEGPDKVIERCAGPGEDVCDNDVRITIIHD